MANLPDLSDSSEDGGSPEKLVLIHSPRPILGSVSESLPLTMANPVIAHSLDNSIGRGSSLDLGSSLVPAVPSDFDSAQEMGNAAGGKIGVDVALSGYGLSTVSNSVDVLAGEQEVVADEDQQFVLGLADIVNGLVSEEVPPVIREAVRPQPADGLGQPPRSTVEPLVERMVGIAHDLVECDVNGLPIDGEPPC
ncbi:hypothetical protein Dimus_018308 [Dionaea muscipula]